MPQIPSDLSRRRLIQLLATGAAAAAAPIEWAIAQGNATVSDANDRIFLCNEDSNTLSVIDPRTSTIDTTINLTSFDEDPRPPFRFVTGGVIPTHGAMIQKPLYHGAISIHGAVPSPDSRLIVTTGRGSSNIYLIDTSSRKIVGNSANPQANAETNAERITSGVFVGREPHEPTFTRNGREIWVTVRGEDRIVVIDTRKAIAESQGGPRGSALRGFVPTLTGPAHVWFSKDGRTAIVISQKVAKIDIFAVSYDRSGFSRATRKATLDISAADKFGFSPFMKLAPDGAEMWMTHKLADAVSILGMTAPHQILGTIGLGQAARPNHVEFAENARGKVVYASLARVDDGGPGGVASSKIAIIDRSVSPDKRAVVGTFFSQGREAHGMWTDPATTRLYIAHEQDELPATPNAGQTVCTVFDIADPLKPGFLTQIPIGDLALPSGKLRNKKSINLVYVRPGARSATG